MSFIIFLKNWIHLLLVIILENMISGKLKQLTRQKEVISMAMWSCF